MENGVAIPELQRPNEAGKKVFNALLAGVAIASLSYFIIWGAGLQPEVSDLAESLGIEDLVRKDTVTDITYKSVTSETVQVAGDRLYGYIGLGSIIGVYMLRAFIIGMRDRARSDRNNGV